jgi:hypothetical protein
MLIGTRVAPNIQRSLDHHGIAWKEIGPSKILGFLREKQDGELVSVFDAEVSLAPLAAKAPARSIKSGIPLQPAGVSGLAPTLLVSVIRKHLNQALAEFSDGKYRKALLLWLSRSRPTTALAPSLIAAAVWQREAGAK